MAKERKKIKPDVKQHLVQEADNKCANPGCSNRRTHLHHIKQWAVFQTDDEKDMIAVCPSCHDAIHHGSLSISDEAVRQWKRSHSSSRPMTTHIYVEPAQDIKLLTGTLAISTANDQAIIFQLSNSNMLRFRILDQDILLVNSKVTDLDGREVLRIIDNHIRSHDDPNVTFEHVPGHVRITIPVSAEYIPVWVVEMFRIQEPAYGLSGRITALDLEVLRPGLVRVQGIWAERDNAVIITESRLSFLAPGLRQPLSLVGAGESSILKYGGAVDKALFGFNQRL